MKAVRNLKGELLGYTLPPEFEKMQKLVEMQSLGAKKLGFLLPPAFQKIKGLVEIQNLAGNASGYLLPPEVANLTQVLSGFSQAFKSANNESLKEAIAKIQSVVYSIPQENGIDTQAISQDLTEISDDLAENKRLSLAQIKKLISWLMAFLLWFIPAYPAIKELYKDLTDDPISEICGAISELEKEAVKFVEVDHQGGIDIYQYPNGKKSLASVLNGTPLCLLAEPKGNAQRIKVVLQLENHKQITGYAERNKLKRRYKPE